MIAGKGWLRWLPVMAAVAVIHSQMDTEALARQGRIAPPDPTRAQALALGFEPVIADWYWIQALQVVGSHVVKDGDNRLTRELIDLVLALDPWVDHPYRFAALWLDRNRDQVRHANRILEQGIAYHPDEWRNRFYLGYNHFLHLGDNQRAAEVLETALAFEDAPDYLGALVTRLKASADSLDAAALFLRELIASTADEYKKAEYGKAFDEVETERRARYLDGAREEYRRRHGRDIERPENLWQGPRRVIAQAPPPHPHFADFAWELDSDSGEIVSSFYRTRYRIHYHRTDLERRRRWDEEEGRKRPSQEEAST